MSAEHPAAQTRVSVDFRQVREALAAVDQASTVFEGLLVAGAELQAENERLRGALEKIEVRSRPCGVHGRAEFGSLRDACEIARKALA